MKNSFLSALTLLILISAGLFAQCTSRENSSANSFKISDERLTRIDRLIKESIDKGYISGARGYIAQNGKVVYDKVFGYEDPASKTPLKEDAIFRIASQTKAITSVAVMMLFEEGKFLLDDPVSKYIPAFANPVVLDKFNPTDSSYTTVPAKREITIRDLLTHTSGIDYAGIGSENMRAIYAKAKIPGGFVSERIFLEDAMKKLGPLPLVHQPGQRFTYGLNIDVLGYLVEVLSGKSLDQFFRERIFDPLGMKDTYFYLPEEKFSRLIPVNMEDSNHRLVRWAENTGISQDYPKSSGTYYSGGAGLVSTIKDYAVFLQMMLNGGEYNGKRLLSRRTVDLMTMNQIGDLNLGPNKFGLGFEITTARGESKLGVTEGSFSWGGFFGTIYWVDPKEKLVCLLFLQQWPLSHGEIHDKFRSLVYQALE